jgi:hypothetical protein
MSVAWVTAFRLSESVKPRPRLTSAITFLRGEVQCPVQVSLEVGLKELAVPAVAPHEGHVDVVPVGRFRYADNSNSQAVAGHSVESDCANPDIVVHFYRSRQ